MIFQSQTEMKIILKTTPQPPCRGLDLYSLKSPVRGFRGKCKKEGFLFMRCDHKN